MRFTHTSDTPMAPTATPMRTEVGAGQAHDTDTPDIETSGERYARRFDGRVGAWFLEVQQRHVMHLLAWAGGGRLPDTVLELGGGHGQLAGPLAAAGIRVDVQGSDPFCAARLEPALQRFPERVRFHTARLDALPFAEGSCDVALAVRLMAHVDHWQGLLHDMGRIARRAVLVDFAPDDGLQRLARATLGVKHRLEGNTRPFFTHSIIKVAGTLAAQGFTEFRWVRQFVFPMAAHRAMRLPWLSRAVEGVAHGLRADLLTGGPVLLCARRPPPSP